MCIMPNVPNTKKGLYSCARLPLMSSPAPELAWHSSECMPARSAALRQDFSPNGMQRSSSIVRVPYLPPLK